MCLVRGCSIKGRVGGRGWSEKEGDGVRDKGGSQLSRIEKQTVEGARGDEGRIGGRI